LHELLQIAFDWSDFHLHRFVIRGKEYGLSRMGCTTFTANRNSLLTTSIVIGTERPFRQASLSQPSIKS
jgi:hypothetical protein